MKTVEALLAHERNRPALPRAEADALIARIEASAALAPAAFTGAAPAAKLAGWKAAVAGLLVGAAAAGVAVHQVMSRPPVTPVVIVLPVPPPPSAPASAPIAEPPPAAAPKPATAARPPARDLGLARERELLDMGRTALARGRPQEALAPLEEHAAKFPTGALAEEREALFIHALLGAGDRARAQLAADAFRTRHPKSLLWPALEAALEE